MTGENENVSTELICPFCGAEMVQGHIWLSTNSVASLDWQEGKQLRTRWMSKVVDISLMEEGFVPNPAKQAYRCSSCKALLTQFKDCVK